MILVDQLFNRYIQKTKDPTALESRCHSQTINPRKKNKEEEKKTLDKLALVVTCTLHLPAYFIFFAKLESNKKNVSLKYRNGCVVTIQ